MTQEVNFLKAVPQPPNYLPAKWIGLGIITLLVILVGASLVHSIFISQLNAQLKSVQQQKVGALKEFQQVAKAYPLFATDKPLVEQVSELEYSFNAKKNEFDAMTHQTMRKPFSEYMKSLSSAVPDGLWLVEFEINQDIENISLQGYCYRPLLVSVLLQRLQKEKIFQDTFFDLFYVQKVKDKELIVFEVANDELLESPDKREPKKKADDEDNQKK